MNTLDLSSHVLVIAFGYAILWVFGVIMLAAASSSSYLGLYRRPTIEDRARRIAKRISE